MITIQVLRIPTEPSAVIPEAYWNLFLSCVSTERRAQAARFIHQADAYRSVIGEVLTRVALSELTGHHIQELSFSRNAYGKPCLTLYPEIHFNVSHSGEWVALISGGTGEMGVDVEKIAPIDLQIAERFFSPMENQYLTDILADQQLHTFYRLWTLKESYIKAVGMGLSIPLDSFSILPDNQQGKAISDVDGLNKWNAVSHLDGQRDRPTRYRFFSHLLDTQHMLAACSVRGILPSKPEIMKLDELHAKLVRVL